MDQNSLSETFVQALDQLGSAEGVSLTRLLDCGSDCSDEEISMALNFYRNNKVLGIAIDTIFSQLEFNQVPHQLRDAVVSYDSTRNNLLSNLLVVSSFLQRNNFKFAITKGFALEHLFLGKIRRDFNDIDVALSNSDGFWALSNFLQSNGFRLETFTVRMVNISPPIWTGSAEFSSPTALSLGRVRDLEINVSGQPLGRFDSLMYDTWFWNSIEMFDQESQIPLTSAKSALAIFFAELVERKNILFRDLIDFTELMRLLNTSQICEVRSILENFDLTKYAARLRRAAMQLKLTDLKSKPWNSFDFVEFCHWIDVIEGGSVCTKTRVSKRTSLSIRRLKKRLELKRFLCAVVFEPLADFDNHLFWSITLAPKIIQRLGQAWVDQGAYFRCLRVGPDESETLQLMQKEGHFIISCPLGTFYPTILPAVRQDTIGRLDLGN